MFASGICRSFPNLKGPRAALSARFPQLTSSLLPSPRSVASGVFNTSLSNEYVLAAGANGMDADHLYTLASDAVDYLFCDGETKERIRMIFVTRKREVMSLWDIE